MVPRRCGVQAFPRQLHGTQEMQSRLRDQSPRPILHSLQHAERWQTFTTSSKMHGPFKLQRYAEVPRNWGAWCEGCGNQQVGLSETRLIFIQGTKSRKIYICKRLSPADPHGGLNGFASSGSGFGDFGGGGCRVQEP